MLALTFALALVQCRPTPPGQAFMETAQALESSDRKAFVAGFSERSAKLLEGLVDLSRVYPRLSPPWGKSQQIRIISETIRGNRAVLVLENGGEQESVLMVLENGRWKIDLFENAPQWAGGVYFR